jgi:hypothetical protein
MRYRGVRVSGGTFFFTLVQELPQWAKQHE